VTVNIRSSLIKFHVTRFYLFTGLTSSLPSLHAQAVFFVLVRLYDSSNSHISSPLQFMFSPVVLVLVVDQLFVSAKFSPEVVYRFIINNTEFYYFKRSSVIHKVFFSFPY
jgi:hypothetical protein